MELQEAVKLDEKAQVVKVAKETLKVGDAVTALGWGIPFQPRAGLPDKLVSARLNVSDVDLESGLTYTAVGRNEFGTPVDTCEGDSGGPLLAWREDAWRLYATLQGGGYNCVTDRIAGDGVWNSLAKYNDWIQEFVGDNQSLWGGWCSPPRPGRQYLVMAVLVRLYLVLQGEWRLGWQWRKRIRIRMKDLPAVDYRPEHL